MSCSRRLKGSHPEEPGEARRLEPWAESFVPELGWVAFDPTNGVCATEAYVRVAAGLDYLGAAPVRGAHFGGGGEALSVSVHVDQAMRQAQN